jgi:hypothetical protein
MLLQIIPLAAEESRYQLPLRGRGRQALDYTKKEIFALGCGIYEIIAWKAPFPEMTEEQIEERYAKEEFPDTEGLLVGDIIRACWTEKFEAAADVEIALREKLMDLRQELVDGMDCLNVSNDETCLIHDDKLLPKINKGYAVFKRTLYNIFTLLYNQLRRFYM